MRILIVEDHDQLRRMTTEHLAERGFVVDQASSLGEARAALAVTAYDAWVLDLGLPDGEGLDLLRERAVGAPTPALLLTARDQLDDRVEGLNAGADDYLVKPFELTELEARIRAVLRRPGRRTPVTLSLGDLRFDTASREALIRGQSLPLRRRESLLLEALLEAEQRVAVRDHLEDRLYGFDEPVTPNALDASISRLRRALDEAGAGLVLETRRGIGYRLRIA